jgi:hypothetical protein
VWFLCNECLDLLSDEANVHFGRQLIDFRLIVRLLVIVTIQAGDLITCAINDGRKLKVFKF